MECVSNWETSAAPFMFLGFARERCQIRKISSCRHVNVGPNALMYCTDDLVAINSINVHSRPSMLRYDRHRNVGNNDCPNDNYYEDIYYHKPLYAVANRCTSTVVTQILK